MRNAGAVLLTYSIIHSFVHLQWTVSFRALGSGLSTRREAASSRSSESGRSNHSQPRGHRQVAFPLQISVSSSLEWDHSGSFSRGTFCCFKELFLERLVLGSLRAWSGGEQGLRNQKEPHSATGSAAYLLCDLLHF